MQQVDSTERHNQLEHFEREGGGSIKLQEHRRHEEAFLLRKKHKLKNIDNEKPDRSGLDDGRGCKEEE